METSKQNLYLDMSHIQTYIYIYTYVKLEFIQ